MGLEKYRRTWEYPELKHEILTSTSDPSKLTSECDFPDFINLSLPWFGLFENMRYEQYHDGLERLALISYRRNHPGLFLPRNFIIGKEHTVPGADMNEVAQKDVTSFGMDGYVGIIHSHPVLRRVEAGELCFPTFSPYDFLKVATDKSGLIYILVDDFKAQITFKSKETPVIDESQVDSLEKYWDDEFSKLIEGTKPRNVYQELVRRSILGWEITRRITKEYHLPLYHQDAALSFKRVLNNSLKF